MTFETTDIKDVLIVRPKTFPDSRGYFRELTRTNVLAENGITEAFVQTNNSFSINRKRVKYNSIHVSIFFNDRDEFYAWTKSARAVKAACEASKITPDKFRACLDVT